MLNNLYDTAYIIYLKYWLRYTDYKYKKARKHRVWYLYIHYISKYSNKISSHFGIIRCNLYTLCSVSVWIILTTTHKFPRYISCCCNCVSRERVNVNFLANVVRSVLHVSYHTIHQIRYYNPISSVEEEIWMYICVIKSVYLYMFFCFL